MNHFRLFLFFSSLLFCVPAIAQEHQIVGIVIDAQSQEGIADVQISWGRYSTQSNEDGSFTLNLPAEAATLSDTLRLSHISYEIVKEPANLERAQLLAVSLSMEAKRQVVDEITVSASRFEKRQSEQTVSIEVLKPKRIFDMGLNKMDEAVQRVPGVDVIDQQVNIRGGAGWSYGAGSRVMVLVDDMPMLSADAADVKWDYMPIENCSQVEIIKGAASSLYGSSALNGVIHFRTGYATSRPKTKVSIFNGVYGNPKFEQSKWWGKQQPQFQGGYISHARKFGDLSVVLGSAWYAEDSYLQGDLSRRIRGNANLRYQSRYNPAWVLGLNINAQLSRTQTFFFWQPSDDYLTTIYQPFGGLADTSTTVNKNAATRFNIDPYIQFTSAGGWKHSLNTRFFRTNNDIPEKQQSSRGDHYYGAYQVHKRFAGRQAGNELNMIAGFAAFYNDVAGELFGNHTASNMAPYLQLEQRWQKLWLTGGVRYEINQIDDAPAESRPVFRAGINYELNPASFLRASYGQGYRMPSIAERFVRTNFGASRVFPNPQLESETGYSYELGFKQLFKTGSWLGYADIAAFWTEYNNMMEFNFGIFLPEDSTLNQVKNPMDYLGFKSINVGRARIYGIDASVNAMGKIGQLNGTILVGYTYMNPMQVNPDSAIRANLSGPTDMLKYRYKHSAKADIELAYKRLKLGGTLLYHSYMENIDAVFANTKPDQNMYGVIFQIGTGLPATITDFRNKYGRNGTAILDLRLAYGLRLGVNATFIVKNVGNSLYEIRPALAGAPRNFQLQLMLDL